MITVPGQISVSSLGMYDYSIAPYSLVWHAHRLIRRVLNFFSFSTSSKAAIRKGDYLPNQQQSHIVLYPELDS